MNTTSTFPTPTVTGGFSGSTVTPFDYESCPCHAAVQHGRDLIAVQRASTMATVDCAAAAVARSQGIVWTGPASEEFHSRMDGIRRTAMLLADDVTATQRSAWGSS